MKAENRCYPEFPGFDALVGGAQGFRRIFDQRDAMFFRDSCKFIHERHIAEQVNGDDRFGAGSYALFDGDRVKAPVLRFDVAKYGVCPEVGNRRRRRNPGAFGHDYLVSILNAQS